MFSGLVVDGLSTCDKVLKSNKKLEKNEIHVVHTEVCGRVVVEDRSGTLLVN